MSLVNPKIFRAYDIRGRYPEEIDEKTAYQIGWSSASYFKNIGDTQIIVGHDPRLSSPVLSRSLIQGIIDMGLGVVNLGLVAVDMVYFASGLMHVPAIMITASHNPKEWNGFKLMGKDVNLMGFDSGLGEILKIIERGQPEKSAKGAITGKSIDGEYIKHVLSFIDSGYIKPMRLAIDTGSGSVGPILKKILEKLPIEYTPLHFTPDGNFPYHEPDPKKERNLSDLKSEVSANHYHLGCAFDGDGDRIVFVDERGDYISPSIAGAIMAKYFLKKNPYGKVVYTVDTGQIVADTIKAWGGQKIREKVGHTNISRRLRAGGGVLGVETSGHYFFKGNFYADSGIIGLMIMLDILSRQNKSLSRIVSEFSKYASVPEINLKIKNPEDLIKKIAQNFEGYEVDWLDGLTVKTSDFWFNLRPSNTEPLVRLNIEAKDELVLNRVKKDLLNLVKKYS